MRITMALSDGHRAVDHLDRHHVELHFVDANHMFDDRRYLNIYIIQHCLK